MSDIRYVCLSDLHLGEESSLLTALDEEGVDPDNPAPVTVELVRCLKELISKNEGDRKPTLILNGDILEMALSTTEISAMVFERFLELLIGEGEELFGQIIYVPGNHDHHIWEHSRETQYLSYNERHHPHELPAPWHKTEMFVEGLEHPPHCTFLERLVNRNSSEVEKTSKKDAEAEKKKEILLAYPNLGLLSPDGKRCVIIHHGHFIETKYRLMSTLRAVMAGDEQEMPEDIQVLEAENFAWIDFLWSAIGRSGDVGKEVEILYEHMHNSEHMKNYISDMAGKFAKRYDIPYVPGVAMEKKVLKITLDNLYEQFSKRERGNRSSTMAEETIKGISLYLNTTNNQIKEECKEKCKKECEEECK